jgi:hypothetical protein
MGGQCQWPIELSRVDGHVPVRQRYLDAVIARFCRRDGQGDAVVQPAATLDVKAWIVLFRWDLTEFWIYNLTARRGWWNINAETYERWLRSLHR